MPSSPALARALHGVIEPLHIPLYLCPEPSAEFEALGLEPRGQGYVAGRAAPLGAIGPEQAAPLFFNFNPALFSYALPAAWDIATPEQVLEAREVGVGKVMARVGVPRDHLSRATDLAVRAWADADLDGLPLAAANAEVGIPDEPYAALWQALTVPREHRGDIHVDLLHEAELQPVEALVLYAAWQGMVSRRFLQMSRMWDDDAWAAGEEGLRSRGLLDAEGALTDRGREFREQLEADTDARAAHLWEGLGEDQSLELFDLLRPMVLALNEGQAFKRPVAVPDRPQ